MSKNVLEREKAQILVRWRCKEIKQGITKGLERKWEFRKGGDCRGYLSLHVKAQKLALDPWGGGRVMCSQGNWMLNEADYEKLHVEKVQ